MRKVMLTIAAMAALASPALAEGDPVAGEKVWKKCKACHVFNEEKNKIGPHLVGIIGRTAGSVEGYKYSKAYKGKQAEIGEWDAAKLDAWLTNPSDFLGGRSKMALKLKKEQQRKDVIAFLTENAKKAE